MLLHNASVAKQGTFWCPTLSPVNGHLIKACIYLYTYIYIYILHVYNVNIYTCMRVLDMSSTFPGFTLET